MSRYSLLRQKNYFLLVQLCVLRRGLLQDGNTGIGVFPEDEEILISSLGFDGVAGECVAARETQVRQPADGIVYDDAGMIENFLELGCCRPALAYREIRVASQIPTTKKRLVTLEQVCIESGALRSPVSIRVWTGDDGSRRELVHSAGGFEGAKVFID